MIFDLTSNEDANDLINMCIVFEWHCTTINVFDYRVEQKLIDWTIIFIPPCICQEVVLIEQVIDQVPKNVSKSDNLDIRDFH